MLDWMCKLVGLPETFLSTSEAGGGGSIQGTASEAVAVALIAARDKMLNMYKEKGATEDEIALISSKLIAYGSSQVIRNG